MKTALEYLKDNKAAVKALSFAYSADCDSRNHLQRIIDAIEQAQKDAYNQAIDDAAENAEVHLENGVCPVVDKESILKLKK